MLKSKFGDQLEAGCDEAGRGCLAGPVVAAAVILPADFPHHLLDDSKKLSEKKRNELRELIQKRASAWSVGVVDNVEIDEINILNASFEAMHKAIGQLTIKPKLLLIDGNRFNSYPDIDHHCIIKGDGKFTCIAAASILAKTYRDEMMRELHDEYPQYAWDRNKGYPTAKHREAIVQNGTTPYHRISFRLLKNQLKLF